MDNFKLNFLQTRLAKIKRCETSVQSERQYYEYAPKADCLDDDEDIKIEKVRLRSFN